MTLRRSVQILLLLFCCGSLLAAQDRRQQLKELAEKVDNRYNRLQSMRSQFTESYNGSGLSRTESGTLWLKKPGKMRWEYMEPRHKLFLSNGKTAWFYVPGDRQARRAPVSKIDDIRSPLRFLLGKTKLMKEFHDLDFVASAKPVNPGNLVLRGALKGLEDRVSRVDLEVTTEGRIDRILIEEVDGAITEFRFTGEEANLAVANNLFEFDPPPGVEVVTATELGD